MINIVKIGPGRALRIKIKTDVINVSDIINQVKYTTHPWVISICSNQERVYFINFLWQHVLLPNIKKNYY